MANHPSAEKRHRQSLKRKARNITQKSRMKTLIKKATAIATKGASSIDISLALNLATSAIDKAKSHGIIHKNAASRRISRLQKQINCICKNTRTGVQ